MVALHHVILRSKAELDQFCEGLDLSGVLNAVKCHPSLTRNFFNIDGKVCFAYLSLCSYVYDIT